MAVTASVDAFCAPKPQPVLGAICLAKNYTRILWPHTWSLAVEEHFYFLLPVVLLGLCALAGASRRFQAVAVAFVIVAVGSLAARILAAHFGVPDLAIDFETQYRIDSLFAGVFIQAWRASKRRHLRRQQGRPSGFLGASYVVSATFLRPPGPSCLAGFSLIWIGYGLVLMSAVWGPNLAAVFVAR